MENMRARSLPPGNDCLVNPFHSEKVQTEYLLHAARPSNLPDVSGMDMEQPVQDASRLAPPRSLMTDAPTGKGRGCQTAGAMPTAMEPTVAGSGNMQTEGRLPGVEKLGSPEVSLQGDDLQRALEVEMLDYLRGENSKLTDEVAFLRGQLKLKSGGNTASGDSSLGAVQLGQLAFSCARGCLKRLSGPSHRNEEGSRQISIESDSGSETSVLELYVTEYQGTVGLSAWFSRCSGWAIFGSWLSGCSGWAIFGSGFSRCRCRAIFGS